MNNWHEPRAVRACVVLHLRRRFLHDETRSQAARRAPLLYDQLSRHDQPSAYIIWYFSAVILVVIVEDIVRLLTKNTARAF